MTAKTKRNLAVLAVAALLLAGGLWRRARRAADPRLGADGGASAGRASWPARPAVDDTPPAAIDGLVVDPDGAPAAGAFVALCRSPDPGAGALGSGGLTAAGRSDGAGHFAFGPLRPGRYAVTATSARPGLAPAVVTGIELAAGGSRVVRLVLARGGFVVRGRVTDSGAGAIGGARVSATRAATPADALRPFVTTTDERGDYGFTLSGGAYSLTAESDGYQPQSRFVTIAGDTSLDFRLDPAARIAGLVLRAGTRAPVAGARVRPLSADGGRYPGPAILADEAGRFHIDDVPPGDWRVEARRGPLVGRTAVLRVVATAALADLEVLVAPGFAVTGQVLAPDQRGLDDAVVVAAPHGDSGGARAKTGPGGAFRIDGLSPGAYDLTASTWEDGAPRGRRQVQVVDQDLAGVAITITAGASVDGELLLDPGGQPAANARVTVLMGEVAGERGRSDVGVTDERGRFSFTGLDAGGLSLWAEAGGEGAAVATWGPEPIAAGESRHVTLRAGAGASVTGNVRYADGAPAAGATVSVKSPAQAPARLVPVDADGRYLARGLVPGWALIAAERGRRAGDGGQRIELGAGREAHLDLALARAASIRGVVLLPDGRPALGAVVAARAQAATSARASLPRADADEDGRFAFEDLDADATYAVVAEMPGYEASAVAVAAGTLAVVLRLRPAAQRRP